MLVRVALIRSQPRARLGRRISRPRAFPSCQQNIRNRETAPERPFRANVSAAQTAKTKREETLSTRSVFATSPWLRIHFAPLIIAFFAFCLSDGRLNSYYCFILLSSTRHSVTRYKQLFQSSLRDDEGEKLLSSSWSPEELSCFFPVCLFSAFSEKWNSISIGNRSRNVSSVDLLLVYSRKNFSVFN